MIWGCRALESVIDSEIASKEKTDISTGDDLLHHRPYEWRLNMRTGQVIKEKNLTADAEFSMDFPIINPNFTGLRNKFGYTQVVDHMSSSTSGDLYKETNQQLFVPFSLLFKHSKAIGIDLNAI